MRTTLARGTPRFRTARSLAALLGAAVLVLPATLSPFAITWALAAAPGAAPAQAQQVDRILPGVAIGSVDLSGLDAGSAQRVLSAAYSSLGVGTINVTAGATTQTIAYSDISRGLDINATVQQALAVGRQGSASQRLAQMLQALLVGIRFQPVVTFDSSVLAARVAQVAMAAQVAPVDANVMPTATGFTTTAAVAGQLFDPTVAIQTLTTKLNAADAPSTLSVSMAATTSTPAITDTAAQLTRAEAAVMAQAVVLANSGQTWTIPATVVHSWIGFASAQGVIQTTVNRDAIVAVVAPLVPKINRGPVSATWAFGPAGVTVVPSVDGRTLNVGGTADKIIALLNARAVGTVSTGKKQGLAITVAAPTLTTAQAQTQASTFTLLSTWTTVFQPAAHNGFGANIWIPAAAIKGQVVQPGATFDFWNAVGPVTLAKGYKLGGAIINGHTEEGVALGGGICSTSTTLFNAALRAGFEMGERENHYYYISRYPVGLDATVSISGNSVQNMTWVNDSPNPVLIESFNGPTSVTFSLYGVPTGRTVTLSTPIITGYTYATTELVHTSALPKGAENQVEYADDGFNSSVTRTVRDASGNIIHQETYYSHYATITGLIYVGDPKAKDIPIPAYAP